MKVFDWNMKLSNHRFCRFLDERPLIDIRLNLLADVVDTFVIMQCPITFMNHSKPMPDPTTFPELAHVKHKIKRLYCDLENYPFQVKNTSRVCSLVVLVVIPLKAMIEGHICAGARA